MRLTIDDIYFHNDLLKKDSQNKPKQMRKSQPDKP